MRTVIALVLIAMAAPAWAECAYQVKGTADVFLSPSMTAKKVTSLSRDPDFKVDFWSGDSINGFVQIYPETHGDNPFPGGWISEEKITKLKCK